jgi:hypothetical protein
MVRVDRRGDAVHGPGGLERENTSGVGRFPGNGPATFDERGG